MNGIDYELVSAAGEQLESPLPPEAEIAWPGANGKHVRAILTAYEDTPK